MTFRDKINYFFTYLPFCLSFFRFVYFFHAGLQIYLFFSMSFCTCHSPALAIYFYLSFITFIVFFTCHSLDLCTLYMSFSTFICFFTYSSDVSNFHVTSDLSTFCMSFFRFIYFCTCHTSDISTFLHVIIQILNFCMSLFWFIYFCSCHTSDVSTLICHSSDLSIFYMSVFKFIFYVILQM